MNLPTKSRRSLSVAKVRTSLFSSRSPKKVQKLAKKEPFIYDNVNRLVNLSKLSEGMRTCLKCSDCDSNDIEVKEKYGVGVSSILEIVCRECKDQSSSSVVVEPKKNAHFYDDDSTIYRYLDFDTNIQSLIASLHMGGGPQESAMLLASLNLEHASSFERAHYTYIDRVSEFIRDTSDDLVKEALQKEIEETYKEQMKEKGYDDETIKEKLKEMLKNSDKLD